LGQTRDDAGVSKEDLLFTHLEDSSRGPTQVRGKTLGGDGHQGEPRVRVNERLERNFGQTWWERGSGAPLASHAKMGAC